MAHTNFIADSFEYGRELVRAGIDGVRAGERPTSYAPEVRIARSARQSLITAAVAGSVALIACKLRNKDSRRIAPMIACGAVAFCADFLWRTREVTPKMIECAEREIDKVRDQHWLASHPIDYA